MTTAVLALSPEQKQAHEAILAFVKESKKTELRIGGYAGTGKTFLIAQTMKRLREEFKKTIALCCFTGKAAYVLRQKMDAAGALGEEYVGTIHGLMYEPVMKDHVIIRWKRREKIDADMIIVDEASMVSEEIWNDLKKYNVPLLAIGDHGQLPPIGGRFSLMENPDHTLITIQRQAEGNPIIRVATLARLGEPINQGLYRGTNGNDGMVARVPMRAKQVIADMSPAALKETMFLCGYNRTRIAMNQHIRAKLGFTKPTPTVGERIICLKNNREAGIFNGMGGVIKKIKWDGDPVFADAHMLMDDDTDFKGAIIKDQFGQEKTIREMKDVDPRELKELFDWGYCLTVHKAQGSEADDVVIMEERFSAMDDEDWRRWLYTAITRARKNLTMLSRPPQ